MSKRRHYDKEYKVEAVKLAKEIGEATAARELGVPANSMYAWIRAIGAKTPGEALSLNEELNMLRKQLEDQINFHT